MSSAICFNLDQSKILSSGNMLKGSGIAGRYVEELCDNFVPLQLGSVDGEIDILEYITERWSGILVSVKCFCIDFFQILVLPI